ncbi:hypothetical protein VSAK1_24520 [Vibrio mediterranei AK1]|uniref:hypothetical protein n=1 Tax=Vibrio mediterranei TaxID=689 RepID=UPI0001542E51|nr:hypothetical protein [Vibrio mediterranei]EDL52679.1 hypothetical protein VSAK1_24520 [Vibrio mediterranei AK1]
MLVNLERDPEMIVVFLAAVFFFADYEAKTYEKTFEARNKAAYINFKVFEKMMWENQEYNKQTDQEILTELNNEWNRRGIYIPENFSERLKKKPS